jgi:hypothetical protein
MLSLIILCLYQISYTCYLTMELAIKCKVEAKAVL